VYFYTDKKQQFTVALFFFSLQMAQFYWDWYYREGWKDYLMQHRY